MHTQNRTPPFACPDPACNQPLNRERGAAVPASLGPFIQRVRCLGCRAYLRIIFRVTASVHGLRVSLVAIVPCRGRANRSLALTLKGVAGLTPEERALLVAVSDAMKPGPASHLDQRCGQRLPPPPPLPAPLPRLNPGMR